MALGPGAGCAVEAGKEDGAGDESVAEAHEALSTTPRWFSWGGVGQYGGAFADFTDGQPATLDTGLNAASGWTCLLSGVFGNTTQGGVSVWTNPGGQIFGGGRTYPTGDWLLAIDALPGNALSGAAVCFIGTTVSQNTTNPPPQTMATNVSGNTFCGFTYIGSGYTAPFNGFATITNDGSVVPKFSSKSTWTWTGPNPGGNDQTDVQCVRSASTVSWGSGGLGSNDNANVGVASGAGCFLSDLSGTFNDNDFSDGVGISPVNPTTWNFVAASGKSAGFYCVE